MKIEIDNEVSERFPGLAAETCMVQNVNVVKSSSELQSFKKELFSEIENGYDLDSLKDEDIIRKYRDFYWKIGIDPTKIRPSSEALIRRILQGKRIPQINTLVDAYNLASMKSNISIGAFDADTIRGPLKMRFASEGEEFLGIGMKEPKILKGVELVVSDSERIIAVYPYRDSDATKVTLDTKKVLLMICGVPGIETEKLVQTTKLTVGYIERFCKK